MGGNWWFLPCQRQHAVVFAGVFRDPLVCELVAVAGFKMSACQEAQDTPQWLPDTPQVEVPFPAPDSPVGNG
eukprot:2868807-Alexandrium_andersonii.AAC.1